MTADVNEAVERLRAELVRLHAYEAHGHIKRATFSVEHVRTVLDALAEAQANDRLIGVIDEVKLTGGTVEMLGVRIEPCDTYGATDTTRALAAAEAQSRICHEREMRFDSERDAAEAKLARITELHTEHPEDIVAAVAAFCNECGNDWPCDTVRILNDEGD